MNNGDWCFGMGKESGKGNRDMVVSGVFDRKIRKYGEIKGDGNGYDGEWYD